MMATGRNAHPEEGRFLELLAKAQFAERYYEMVDDVGSGSASIDADRRFEHEEDLATTALDFQYFAAENFHRHERTSSDGTVWKLHLSFSRGEPPWSSIEVGMYGEATNGLLGGTAHGLARRLTLAAGGDDRRYPRLRYSSTAKRRALILGSTELFNVVESACAEAAGW